MKLQRHCHKFPLTSIVDYCRDVRVGSSRAAGMFDIGKQAAEAVGTADIELI